MRNYWPSEYFDDAHEQRSRVPKPGFFSSLLEQPRVESAAMRTRIYPWIILCAVLSTVILYAPSDLYKYARKEARTTIVKLQLKLDRMRMRYGRPAPL